MQRQNERGVMGDFQIVGRDGHALRAQGRDLFQQRPRVNHHAIADDRQLPSRTMPDGRSEAYKPRH